MGRKRQNKVAQPRKPRAEKQCPVCERPFHWRARWKNNWDEIVYCSRRCAGQRSQIPRPDPG
ncbi:MAG: DUF2256 domain-containing protein [Congregibacter sp.]